MGQSSSIEERPAPATPAHYTWSFPGAPVQVRLLLDCVERLRRRLESANPASASHGLLLGRIAGQVTELRDFAPLTDPALPSAADVAARLQSAGSHSLVGYYKITRDPAFRLDDATIHLAETMFPNPRQVVLLVQLNDSDPPNATFFFWDNGRMCGEFPFLEFPFDPTLLAQAEQQKIESSQKKAAALADGPPVSRQAPRQPGRTLWEALLWSFLILTIVGAGGAALVLKLAPRPNRPAVSVPAPPARQSSLDLRAERQNGDLKLTWNRQSPEILNSISGILSIEDGTAKRELTLDPGQVRWGSILYAPVSDQVQVQLRIFGLQGETSESVIVILPKNGAPQVHTMAHNPISAEPPPAAAPALKPFIPPAEPTALSPAPGAAIAEPPSLAAAPVRQVTGLLPIPTPAPPPLPSPRERSAAAPAVSPTTVRQQAQSPSRPAAPQQPVYTPPSIVRRVLPAFPATLRNIGMRPKIVAVKVSIDENGKVVKAEALPSKDWAPELLLVTVNAARLWRFNPARSGATAIPSEMLVQFEFKSPD